MPAAAVIPALKAYTRVVAVKKLVVGRGEGQIEKNRVFKGEVGEHRTSTLLFIWAEGENRNNRGY